MKQMKFTLAIILIAAVFAIKLNKENVLSETNQVYYTYSPTNWYRSYYTSPYYYYLPSAYYSPCDTPVATSVVTPITRVVSPAVVSSPVVSTAVVSAPSYYYSFWWRKASEKTKQLPTPKEPTLEEAKKELAALKKTVYGDENYDTTKLREEGKAYDTKWLLSQLKVTRALEIEDILKLIEKNNQPARKAKTVKRTKRRDEDDDEVEPTSNKPEEPEKPLEDKKAKELLGELKKETKGEENKENKPTVAAKPEEAKPAEPKPEDAKPESKSEAKVEASKPEEAKVDKKPVEPSLAADKVEGKSTTESVKENTPKVDAKQDREKNKEAEKTLDSTKKEEKAREEKSRRRVNKN